MDGITQLLGYRITQQLYAGSRTLVYRAVRERDGTHAIIKLLRNPFPNFNELLSFRNQYAIAKNLDLPSIVKPLKLEPYKNAYALVMEDFGGISLKQMLEREGNMGQNQQTLTAFLQIAIQIAEAFHGLYRYRLIHKDLKPANIVIHPDTKQIKLIDFSIASLLPRETQEIQNANALEGTLAYLSPEQTGRMNRGIDYRSDFYSLGITFYELLTGQLPFESTDPIELVHCHLAKQATPVDRLQTNVPSSVSLIVCKLMAKNAEDRYQSALGLKHDLEKCLHQLKETGKIEPFELATRDLCDRFNIPEKLYGRKAEVEALLNAFDRVSTGKAEMMLVAGFSGIGKTAAVNEVHKPIVRQRGYFIKGKYDQFGRNIPFSAFVQAFRDLMGQLVAESDVQLQIWKTQILEVVGENGQVLIDVIPELERIIGKQPPAPELSGSAAHNRFNLLMQKFVQVLTTADHPLVLFLDDLQWADSASLKLMELLVQDTGHLLVIGAYRDNEVSRVHPLMLTVDRIGKTGATVNTITLQALSLGDINQLVADTLNCDRALAQPLTELVYKKTKGNPFFATVFLKSLHEDGLISFDYNTGYWECNIARICTLASADDVVEFMALQLQKLPIPTQDVLKLAACIGAEFDLTALAIISQQSEEETAAALWKALQEGLIIPTTESYKFFTQSDTASKMNAVVNPIYRFLHDRVQQAAYSLIPENQKQTSHLSIGRLLLRASSQKQASDVFKVVNQFNQCLEIVDSPDEILTIAKLNHIAAAKARETTAFLAAAEYAQVGIHLLSQDAWQANYDLMLALRNCLAEAAYLSGNFDLMTNSIADILSHARILEDRLYAYEVKLQALKAQNQLQEALVLGLKILNLLQISLPAEATPSDIEQAFTEMEAALKGRAISSLIALPEMSDRAMLAATRILASLGPVAHMLQFNLLPILLVQQVKLALRYGNAPAHTHAYAVLGIILCGSRGDIERGYEAGQLALALLDCIEAEAFRSASTFVATYFTLPWKISIQSTFNLILKAYTSGANSGDLEHAAYAVERYGQLAYFSGAVELSDLATQMDGFAEFIRKSRQDGILPLHNMNYQVVLNWQGKSIDPLMITGAVYDENILLPQQLKQNNRMALINYYLHKLILAYSFADRSQVAVDHAIQTRQYLDSASSSILMPVFHTYESLACLHNYANVSPEEQQQYLAKIEENQDKLKNWATYAPMNYLHKNDLVEAERCRVLLRKYEAGDFYDRAIAGAKTNGYIQEEALANELAAKFYLDWDKAKIAAGYMQEAYYCYARWGAKAKVDDFEQRYPHLLEPILLRQQQAITATETLFSPSSHTRTSTSSNTSISESLDLATLLNASQMLSSEIELDKLLLALLRVVLENAGADKCALLMPKDGRWAIEAMSQLGQSEILLHPGSIEESQAVPVSAINTVKHTLQSLVIGNAIAHPTLAADPYILRQCPKSVLCAPLLNQGKLIGILYLENNLTIGAFTGDRIKLLNLICTQAAISLENARLYQQSQQALTDLKEAQLQIVQSEKMSALGNLVAGIAHEINNPVAFLNGNIDPALDYIKDIFGLVDLYQQEYPQPSSAIEDEIEAIDLKFIRDDLPKLVGSMREGVKRIRDISTSLRTFSRSDCDRPVPFNIHEGIDSTLLILKHRLKANEFRPSINVITDYGDLPPVECFAGQLNQVFMNLLSNAIDALEESNTGRSFASIQADPNQIIIKTELSSDRQQSIIRIQDNGMGMTDAVKQKIFDHLFTTKTVGKGTGLGLAIARQIIVDKHCGTLSVNSTLDRGTEFAISLPVKAIAQAMAR